MAKTQGLTYTLEPTVLKPLLIKALRSSQDVSDPNMELNRPW
ncbi:MAG: hypothetical protein V3T53_16160 [Phycisphaerales bacterium]